MPPARLLGASLLLRGLTVDRRRPDLEALARETRPERFVWRVLPHVARSFAASIVVLPPAQARAAAVAYLYCRMLDTYEDLIVDSERSIAELRRFAARFDSRPLSAPTPLDDGLGDGPRERVYLLLLARCGYVDAVFETLPPDAQRRIGELVGSMADGMAWASDAFARQQGVLVDEQQLARYCRSVIGHPAVFALNLVATRELSERAHEDALLVSEMIQLANVSRDVERDLARGIAYHPALRPFLGDSGHEPESSAVVRQVREQYVTMALDRAPAYRRLFDELDLGGRASVRAAAVLMLLFTDLHYRSCVRSAGHRPWPGPRGNLQVIAGALPALLSPDWTGRTLRRVEIDFAEAAASLRSASGRQRAAFG